MAATPTSPPTVTSAPSLRERFRAVWARRETVLYLTSSALKAGHRDKVLGHLWNILDPLMFMLVYYLVFGVLFALAQNGGRDPTFLIYIFIGILVFQFISGTTMQASTCIRGNRGLVHEISFPKAVFPISVALSRLYDLAWGMVVVVVFLLVFQIWPTFQVLWVPLLLSLVFLFGLGAALIVAYLGAFFADTTNIVNVALRLLFYMSAIFFYVRSKPELPGEMIFSRSWPDALYTVFMLNPFVCFFELFRDAMLWGDWPEMWMLAYAAIVSFGVFLIGFALFTAGEGKFAKYI